MWWWQFAYCSVILTADRWVLDHVSKALNISIAINMTAICHRKGYLHLSDKTKVSFSLTIVELVPLIAPFMDGFVADVILDQAC